MQKVGDRLSKYDIVNEVFDAIGEIAKKSDFISAGLKDQDVYALCRQGYLERVKKGYYKLAVGDEPKEELILLKLMTHGVVCVESALFYYGYSDFAPREWSITVPRSYSRTVKAIQEEVPVKAYYVQNPMYHLGETTGTFNGVALQSMTVNAPSATASSTARSWITRYSTKPSMLMWRMKRKTLPTFPNTQRKWVFIRK